MSLYQIDSEGTESIRILQQMNKQTHTHTHKQKQTNQQLTKQTKKKEQISRKTNKIIFLKIALFVCLVNMPKFQGLMGSPWGCYKRLKFQNLMRGGGGGGTLEWL